MTTLKLKPWPSSLMSGSGTMWMGAMTLRSTLTPRIVMLKFRNSEPLGKAMLQGIVSCSSGAANGGSSGGSWSNLGENCLLQEGL